MKWTYINPLRQPLMPAAECKVRVSQDEGITAASAVMATLAVKAIWRWWARSYGWGAERGENGKSDGGSNSNSGHEGVVCRDDRKRTTAMSRQ